MEKDQLIDQQFHVQLNALGHLVDAQLNGEVKEHDRKIGFALFVFKPDGSIHERANYMSNKSHKDMLAGLKEFIADIERWDHA